MAMDIITTRTQRAQSRPHLLRPSLHPRRSRPSHRLSKMNPFPTTSPECTGRESLLISSSMLHWWVGCVLSRYTKEYGTDATSLRDSIFSSLEFGTFSLMAV